MDEGASLLFDDEFVARLERCMHWRGGRMAWLAVRLLVVLDRQGVDVSYEQFERVLKNRDEARLNEWARRAVHATSANDVFG